MAQLGSSRRGNGRRKSILDIAPLELDCLNALWPLGEATVRDIRDRIAPVRPRAYTTIMTIMDRLAQKGVVTRRKVGRAYFYQPNLSVEQARSHAVAQLVAGFFGGSAEALLEHLRPGETSRAPLEAGIGRPAARLPRPAVPERREEADKAGFVPRMDETLL